MSQDSYKDQLKICPLNPDYSEGFELLYQLWEVLPEEMQFKIKYFARMWSKHPNYEPSITFRIELMCKEYCTG